MARAKKTAARTATVTVDVADMITEKLNEIDGIEFARDAWENKAPDQYGVVTLAMEPIVQYADGEITDEIYQITVDIYATDSADTWPGKVREKLMALESNYEWLDLSCRVTAREYSFDIDKVHWALNVKFCGPLVREIAG